MRLRDLPAAIRNRMWPPHTGRRVAAARVRPYVAPAPQAEPDRLISVECPTCGGWHAPGTKRCPLLPPTRVTDDHLYARRRIVPPWAPQAVVTPPPALPAGDGLDDVRTALEGPVRAWLTQQAETGRDVAEVAA